MSKITLEQFLQHWRRHTDQKIRPRITLPGSLHFSLDEMEAELALDLKDDPIAKDLSFGVLVKRIVGGLDRGRRPRAKDVQQQDDLFRFEHKWIPVGKRTRIRYSEATPLDLNEWLRIVNDQFAAQSEAYTAMVAQIQRDLSAMLRTGGTTIGEMWHSQYGWEPTTLPDPPPDDDYGDDDDVADDDE
jgi:hypothetical protein